MRVEQSRVNAGGGMTVKHTAEAGPWDYATSRAGSRQRPRGALTPGPGSEVYLTVRWRPED